MNTANSTNPKQKVVVGVDGSTDSQSALEWAVDPEKGLGDIEVVTAYSVGPMVDGLGLAPQSQPEVFRQAAEERSRAVIAATDPVLLATHKVAPGFAGRMLVDASANADLIVVGCRSRGSLTRALLGSVGSFCVTHSASPVAIVPDGVPTKNPLNRLIVGVDGSENSKRAIRWALEHVATGGTVEAVAAVPTMAHAFSVGDSTENDLLGEASAMAKEAVAAVATADDIARLVDVVVTVGDPRVALRKAAERADALVVGARGTRGVAYLLLGSVATALSHQPTVVTIVVPDIEDSEPT